MAGTITYNDIVSRLLAAIPELKPDSEDVTDNLVYLVFGELMRFAKAELESNPGGELVQKVFAFFEEAARSHDPLVTDVLLDALHDFAIPDPDKARAVMGRFTRKLFRKVVKEVYGGLLDEPNRSC